MSSCRYDLQDLREELSSLSLLWSPDVFCCDEYPKLGKLGSQANHNTHGIHDAIGALRIKKD
jgi:hypothetical protein